MIERFILMLAVLTLSACSTAGHQVKITNQTLAGHSASNPYIIDLTEGRDTYDVAANIDYSRLRVRTDIPLEDFMQQWGAKADQRIVLGDLNDLVDIIPSDGEGTIAANCLSGGCTCNGRKDCSDLSKSGKCASGPNAAACGQGVGGGSGWGCTCTMKK